MGGRRDQIKHGGLGRFSAKFTADRALTGAVQIAWQAMFSAFPLILGLLGLFGLVLDEPAQRRELADAVAAFFPSQVGDLVGFVEETHQLSGWLGAASVVGLAWSGYWLFQTIELVFNHFYGVPERSFRRQVVMALTMMATYAALFTLSVLASVVSGVLLAMSERALPIQLGGVDPFLGWLLALGSAFGMFLAMYWVVPHAPLTLSDVWPGALVASVLFVALSQAFPLYFWLVGGAYAVYQTLGLFLVLMTWFYCLAVILVLGAELNAFLAGRRGAQEIELAAMQVLLAKSKRPVGRVRRKADQRLCSRRSRPALHCSGRSSNRH